MVEILVAEDFEQFRRHITSIIREHTGLRVICEVSDGLEAVQKATELQPDLVLLDIGLPTLNGIEVARRIRKDAPQAIVVFLTQESSATIVSEAFALGAKGYIAKLDLKKDLLIGINAVVRGEMFISRSLTGPDFPKFSNA